MGYVYKFTHKETGKWYIGSHNGKKTHYKGSGLLFSKAVKKYGIESFVEERLYEGDDFRYEEERILKEVDAANDSMSYNMKNEALGGSFPGELNGMYGKTLSIEERYECGKAFRGKKRPDHSEKMKGENNPAFGKSTHTYGIIKYAKCRKGISNKDFFGEEKAAELSKKLSEAQTGKPKPGTSAAMKGGGNSSAKKIELNGVVYSCIKDAMEATGYSRHKVKKNGNLI